MTKLFIALFKSALFTILILVLGAWVTVGGRSVSGHIEAQIRKAKRWEMSEKFSHYSSGVLKNEQPDLIESSEREKLKKLISDLNR